jgi:outer membrane usher protein FimD/PapC
MLFLLFVLLAGGTLFLSYYFTNQIYTQRKQMLLLKKQNSDLKNKLKYDKPSNLTVHYIAPNFTEAFTADDCNLYISPVENSIVLNSLSKNTNIKILYSAEIKDELWYEISIESNKNINNKGWIQSKFINPYIGSA